MRMEKNSWRLAITIVFTQVAILAVVMAIWFTVAPGSREIGPIGVSVFWGTFASAFITRKFAV